MREEAISYFSSLLSEEQVDRLRAQDKILEAILKLVDEEENKELMRPITMEDLESTIAAIKSDK